MANYKTKSKSKTFQKSDEQLHELLDFIMNSIETYDDTPPGTNWSDGEPTPFDPVTRLSHKYVITVTRIEE